MKISSLALVLALILAPVSAYAAPSSMFEYRSHVYSYDDGWPKWIGRLHAAIYERYKRPELATRYLPLSLVRTGRFEEIVEEVEKTPHVDTTNWPAWIDGQ